MNTAADYITTMNREEQERRGKIRMYPSMRYVDPFNLQPDDISIEDIAHHLSCVNRFTGGYPFPLSVAQHSVWVSENVGPDLDLQLAGLLHDAPESFINDLASPVKYKFPDYVALDKEITRRVYAKFGLPFELLAQTKPMDDKAFFTEAASAFAPETLLSSEKIREITWRQAKKLFLDRYESIQRRRAQRDQVQEAI